MNELISIIIPVYNVADFLPRCMESIFRQSYKNIEILLIDDGSTDYSAKMCDEYANQDNRVRAFHQRNQGVSTARNRGLVEAKGEAIAFIDADDYVKDDYIAVLHNDMVKNDVEMVCCNYIELGLNKQSNKYYYFKRNLKISGRDECMGLYWNIGEKGYFPGVVWGCLIKTGLAKSHQFLVDQKQGEDTLYVFELFSEGGKVYFDTYEGYYYYRRENSATMREKNTDISIQIIRLGEIITKYTEFSINDEIRRLGRNEYALRIYVAISQLLKNNNKNEYEKYIEILRNHSEKALKDKKIKMKYRSTLTIYSKYPNFYWYVWGTILRMKETFLNVRLGETVRKLR